MPNDSIYLEADEQDTLEELRAELQTMAIQVIEYTAKAREE